MAKQIVFTYEDKEYTLEFTRRTVKQMEDEGFVAQVGKRTGNGFGLPGCNGRRQPPLARCLSLRGNF